jgi:excisionase family DNA binding protein
MEELLTAKEVANVLKVNRKTVINLINAKKLKASMVGVQYRVRKEDLQEYIKQMEV